MSPETSNRGAGLAVLLLCAPTIAFAESPGQPAAAASAPQVAATIPGGALDPSFLGTADAYVGRPAAAMAGPACKAAKAYVDDIQAGRYDQVANLFAPDAVVLEPNSVTPRIGRRQIDDFFRNTIGPMKPRIVAVSFIGRRPDCIAEFAVEVPINGQPRYILASVDHFTMGTSGAIIRMIAFSRPLGPGFGAPRKD